MDFVERQESVPVSSVLDEGGLEGGFDPGHLREVDIPPELFVAPALEIKLFDAVPVDHRHARLLRVRGVD